MPDESEPIVIDSPPFNPEPRTQAEYLRAIWADMKVVKAETKRTNGRVSRIERILVAAGAFLVGAGVVLGLDLPPIPWL